MQVENKVEKKCRFTELRRIVWPIEGKEHKKFLPMAAMMFCILYNYSLVRTVKDTFVVSDIGPEAMSFLKTYLVFPSAVLAMVIYSWLCNIMSPSKVFYTITATFFLYFTAFTFILYPSLEFFHPNPETIENLVGQYPAFKWFIKIAGQWTIASFYTMSELWGAVMLSLLFWQFANNITKTSEAKRFYSMFGLLGNFALLLTSVSLDYFLDEATTLVPKEIKFMPLLITVIISTALVKFLYGWINRNVLTDPDLYQPVALKSKKNKVKLPLSDSFKMIFTSKYLGLLVILVLAYGISINLVEGVWKAKVKELYPTKEGYGTFMAGFQFWQGIAAILFMIVGSNILRIVSWKTAAILTPLMIIITGIAFFCFIFFGHTFSGHVAGFLSSGPLALAVGIGLVQNVLSKATKYSLFDSTKEMAYIPLDEESKSKGKAAVDVVGGRFGKSGGGIIQSIFFMFGFSFSEATPYFAGIFFFIAICWLFAVFALSKEYEAKIKET